LPNISRLVVARVDRDEDDIELCAIRAELFPEPGHAGKTGRAYIGATGEAEEDGIGFTR
jgi:hypothetical protein